jgi:hypothetical protein
LFDATSGGSAVTTDGSAVARWEDQSGNGRHATQSTSNNRPILKTSVQNSKNIVRYDGSNDELGVGAFITSDTTPVWVFTVNKFGSNSLFGNTANFDRFAYFYFATSTKIGIGRHGATDEVTANHSANIWAVISGFSQKINSSTETKIRINKSETTKSANTSGGQIFNLVGKGGAFAYNGDIGELLVYNQDISLSNIEKIEDYLNTKWNIF